MISAASGLDPAVTFVIVVRQCVLSPGLIRSGLYPTEKSVLNVRFDSFSRMGTQISSVAPGYTVDSYTTISPSDRLCQRVSWHLGVDAGLVVYVCRWELVPR